MLRLKILLMVGLGLVCFGVKAQDNYELKTNAGKISSLIQNNLKNSELYMYHAGKYEVKKYGNIVLADTPGPDYNIIFNYETNREKDEDLKQALEYSVTHKYPFMVVCDQKPNIKVRNLLAKFNYQETGMASKMAIVHDNINFTAINQNLIVKEVNNPQMLATYCELVDEVFGRSLNSSKIFMAPMNKLLAAKSQLKFYLAYLMINGKLEPVAASSLYLPANKHELAGHYSWAVKEKYRKQGIMTNLVKNMLLIAKHHGYRASVVQAYANSARIAKRLGFKEYEYLYLYVNIK